MLLKFLVADTFYYKDSFSEKSFSVDIDPTNDIENVIIIQIIFIKIKTLISLKVTDIDPNWFDLYYNDKALPNNVAPIYLNISEVKYFFN